MSKVEIPLSLDRWLARLALLFAIGASVFVAIDVLSQYHDSAVLHAAESMNLDQENRIKINTERITRLEESVTEVKVDLQTVKDQVGDMLMAIAIHNQRLLTSPCEADRPQIDLKSYDHGVKQNPSPRPADR